VRACRRHYGVQTELASLFSTFGIFSRHRAERAKRDTRVRCKRDSREQLDLGRRTMVKARLEHPLGVKCPKSHDR
jgi:hypothetical protein